MLVALGEPMIEFNQTGEGAGRTYLQGFGGDTSNFAIAAARFPDAPLLDGRLGRHISCYVGAAAESPFRERGSSGGFPGFPTVYVQCNITLLDFSPGKAHLAPIGVS